MTWAPQRICTSTFHTMNPLARLRQKRGNARPCCALRFFPSTLNTVCAWHGKTAGSQATTPRNTRDTPAWSVVGATFVMLTLSVVGVVLVIVQMGSDVRLCCPNATCFKCTRTLILAQQHEGAMTTTNGCDLGNTTVTLNTDDCICTVCYELCQHPLVLTCGGNHMLCRQCFFNNQNTCPFCRKKCGSVKNTFMAAVVGELEEDMPCGQRVKVRGKTCALQGVQHVCVPPVC